MHTHLPQNITYVQTLEEDIIACRRPDRRNVLLRGLEFSVLGAFVVGTLFYYTRKLLAVGLESWDFIMISSLALMATIFGLVMAGAESQAVHISNHLLVVRQRFFGLSYFRRRFVPKQLAEVFHDEELVGEDRNRWICLVCPNQWMPRTWLFSPLSREQSILVYQLLKSSLQARHWTVEFRDPRPFVEEPLPRFAIRHWLIAMALLGSVFAVGVQFGPGKSLAWTFLLLSTSSLYYGASRWRKDRSEHSGMMLCLGFLFAMSSVFFMYLSRL